MLDKYSVYLSMGKSEYYDSEERLGRSRKYRDVFEDDNNVVDFELYVLPHAFKQGGERLLKRVYSHYLKKGYNYLGK